MAASKTCAPSPSPGAKLLLRAGYAHDQSGVGVSDSELPSSIASAHWALASHEISIPWRPQLPQHRATSPPANQQGIALHQISFDVWPSIEAASEHNSKIAAPGCIPAGLSCCCCTFLHKFSFSWALYFSAHVRKVCRALTTLKFESHANVSLPSPSRTSDRVGLRN